MKLKRAITKTQWSIDMLTHDVTRTCSALSVYTWTQSSVRSLRLQHLLVLSAFYERNRNKHYSCSHTPFIFAMSSEIS